MSSIAILPQEAIDGSLPMRKRKEIDGDVDEQKPAKKSYMSKAREIRLEQNRKAARESRRRKKVMIEELQRSVIFFSRANGTLKQQNEELTRFLVQAQAQVSAIESDKGSSSPEAASEETSKPAGEQLNAMDQSETQEDHVLAAAHATAQLANGASTSTKSEPSSDGLPQMQPGATMQAMANFQQAATAAMQAAVQGMQGNGSLGAIAPPPPTPPRAQQIFSDTMAAIAMQQAAAAAVAGQQFLNNPFMAPMLAWQNHQVVAAMAQAAAPGTQNNPASSSSQISSPKRD